MSIVVDTNVLVYAAVEDVPEHGRAVAALERWTAGPSAWHVTWSVLYEMMRVLTHPRVFAKPFRMEEALDIAARILAHPRCVVLAETRAHLRTLRVVFAEARGPVRGNFIHDCHIAALMREHGVRRILTADRGFERFPFIEVVPLDGA